MAHLHWLPAPVARGAYLLLRMPHWRRLFVALALVALIALPHVSVPVLIGGINPLAPGPGTGPWWTQDLPVGAGSGSFLGPDPWYDVTNPAYAAGAPGQAAINACGTGGGGIVFYPPGVQLFNTAGANGLTISADNITLQGTGRGSSVLRANAAIDQLIRCDNHSNFNMFDLDLDGHLQTNKILGVTSSGGTLCRHFTVQRCRIHNNSATANGWAVIFWDTQQASAFGGLVQRVRFLDSVVEDCTSTLIDVMSWSFCTDVVVANSTFNNLGRSLNSFVSLDVRTVNNYFGTFVATVSPIFSSKNDIVIGNHFDNCGVPIRFDAASNGQFVANYVNNCDLQIGQITGNTDTLIANNFFSGVIEVRTGNIRVAIVGNNIVGNNDDHTVQIDAGASEVLIADNTIGSTATVGKIAVHVQSDYTVVRGNKIRDGRGGSATINAAIKLDSASHCLIDGNTIRDLVGGAPAYQETGTSDFNVVSNNIVGAFGLAFVGAHTVARYNQGFNPQGTANIAVTASPFTYTNNDNVDEMVNIFGGTVTTVAKDGNNLFSHGGAAANDATFLRPSEAITVTYTVAPTMVKDRK